MLQVCGELTPCLNKAISLLDKVSKIFEDISKCINNTNIRTSFYELDFILSAKNNPA